MAMTAAFTLGIVVGVVLIVCVSRKWTHERTLAAVILCVGALLAMALVIQAGQRQIVADAFFRGAYDDALIRTADWSAFAKWLFIESLGALVVASSIAGARRMYWAVFVLVAALFVGMMVAILAMAGGTPRVI